MTNEALVFLIGMNEEKTLDGHPLLANLLWSNIKETISFHDCLDGRIAHRNYIIRWSRAQGAPEAHVFWQSLVSSKKYRSMRIVGEMPRFARELPAGSFRTELMAVIKNRSILRKLRVESNTKSAAYINADGGQVAQLLWQTWTMAESQKQIQHLIVKPIMCDDIAYLALLQSLRAVTNKVLPYKKAFHKWLGMASQDLIACPPETTTNFGRSTPTSEALNQIFNNLSKLMNALFRPVVDDVDVECLHDFRIALRRTRTLLRVSAHLWPNAIEVQRQFANIGSITGHVRDLDVYVDKIDTLAVRFDLITASRINMVRQLLVRRRVAAQRKLVENLHAHHVSAFLNDWVMQLTSGDENSSGLLDRAISENASLWIEKAYGHVRVRSRSLGKASPLANFHDLRLRAKRLRYLLESFEQIWRRPAIVAALRQLKQMLKVFGDLNDVCTQRENLEADSKSMIASPDGHLLVMAVGHLDAFLLKRQLRLCRQSVIESKVLAGKEFRRLIRNAIS